MSVAGGQKKSKAVPTNSARNSGITSRVHRCTVKITERVGCCGALMAALFALGIMSVVWMAVIAGLIAFEKTVPWRRVASYGTAAVLLALGLLVLTAPRAIPGLTTPRDAPMGHMTSIDS